MNTTAAATETTTVVRIGKGLTFHAQMKGVETAWAACGTVSSKFGAAKQTTGIVSCRKCLDAIAAEEALADESPVVMQLEPATEAAVIALSTPVEAVLTGIIAEVVATTPAAATVPTKGDLLTHKDGAEFTMISLSKDGKCYRVANEDGKASYIRISNFL